MRRLTLLAALLVFAQPALADVSRLFERDAGADAALLSADARELVDLGLDHIDAVGLEQATTDFMGPPWKREGNVLHLWGLTTSGLMFFDAGHPELLDLDATGMIDLEGVEWAAASIANAADPERPILQIKFPHPTTGRPATTFINCQPIEGHQDKILCSGSFLD